MDRCVSIVYYSPKIHVTYFFDGNIIAIYVWEGVEDIQRTFVPDH
jgi:hypothetical protein